MKKITIIGAGFAGLTAVRELRKLDKSVEITLISPVAELHYLPGIIWIPSGRRQREDLVISLDNYFSRMKVKFHQGNVTGLRDGGRVVETDNGEITNDGLIIGSGGRFIKKLPGIERAITPCEGITAAEKIRDRLKEMQGGNIAIGFAGNPKEPSAMRGGPMFEFLFGLDTQLRQEGRRDNFKLTFFSPAPQPGNRLGPKAVKGLLEEMKKRNIDTHLGHKMKGFSETGVTTEGGEFPADLILFMPGMTGNKWFDNSELPRSEGGLIKADAQCRVEGMKNVYVAGDSGSFPGPDWMPKQAHMADLQATAAAKNLLTELDGSTPSETFKVELVCIVDSNSKGMLVSRNEKRALTLPACRMFHWMKRGFEWWYLKQYR
ncbi:NAD(P)/FAD-dependent oxidoreductase [Solemya velum gill symbiont]|uniref:Pyridine nucleotide-disulfide oxidoreductase n=1 Tax=Solemya velum gill symbiont TaxID=2340 RepID=A0A0B0H6M7_SOVGS|nr:FAD-dependent oxidoreductase [Solemya velum gill symbiont]KHF25833.1 sulfide-quinone reductase Sqr [Solemya velum gill symbiont]OOY34534.1 pyridine nucleotide-disulfide oxidoreductase [Solemya velum gill symbiont]OOY37249.1 pyridine nucleotide-disulfide oxidoreductase [Solemya velum gill symbiont]OOY39757.1 pyridine nucleotide-disulfide oxidoreductase [Solemya velum gill symbiont]OOY42048.1 pyridine nucleotide-disulfide oxidoreductase [Solemya velum gill symbiont]